MKSRYVTALDFAAQTNVLWVGTKAGSLLAFPVSTRPSSDNGG